MNDRPFVVRSHDVQKDASYREQLLFNWQLGRDLVLRRAEEKWGKGVVEQLSIDLQDAFPGVKGFSARNLWFMKQWYLFYSADPETVDLIQTIDETIPFDDGRKLKQVASEIQNKKLKQLDSEIQKWMLKDGRALI